MTSSGIKKPPVHDMWCHSQLKKFPFSYVWTIDNFSLRGKEVSETLYSPTFTHRDNDQISFRLSVYPNGDQVESKDYLSVFLSFISCEAYRVTAEFEISILNAEKKKRNILNDNFMFKNNSSIWRWPKFIKRDFLMMETNELLPHNTLTLFCEGSFFTDNVDIARICNTVQFKVPKCTVLLDFGQLLQSRKFSDVTICTCDEKIRAHKAILAARSTVFSAMFDCKMQEEEQNRIEITDVEPEVIREMLQFIYTSEAPNLDKMAADLLAAADKYDLIRLKVMCAEELFKTLTTDNAVDVLILADRHNEKQLKSECIDFINTDLKHVIDTPSYESMVDSHPYLIDEILRASVETQS